MNKLSPNPALHLLKIALVNELISTNDLFVGCLDQGSSLMFCRPDKSYRIANDLAL